MSGSYYPLLQHEIDTICLLIYPYQAAVNITKIPDIVHAQTPRELLPVQRKTRLSNQEKKIAVPPCIPRAYHHPFGAHRNGRATQASICSLTGGVGAVELFEGSEVIVATVGGSVHEGVLRLAVPVHVS